MKEIKDRIAQALAIRNMKPVELSEKTKISKSSISQYMSGYAKPKQDNIYLIAKALDVTEAWLLGYDVEMERSENFSAASAILDAKFSNDLVLKEAIKKYYDLSEKDQADVIEFINYKHQKAH